MASEESRRHTLSYELTSSSATSIELSSQNATPTYELTNRSTASYEPILNAAEPADDGRPGEQDDRASQTSVAPPPEAWQWPPQPLQRGLLESLGGWAWDILLTLAPICFFALTVVAIHLDGEQLSPYGANVMRLTRLSPTVYPILFASLTSRFFRNLTRWLLESDTGVPLGLLEQLFGSQSLAGTIERLLFVRVRIAVGFTVLAIWAISPIGGQSALQLLSTSTGSTQHLTTIYYANSFWQFREFGISGAAQVNSMYTVSLFAPAHRGSPVDLWAWPKIPQWPRNYDGSSRPISKDEQKNLASEQEYYISLLGVPIRGLVEDAEYNFTVETFYYEFECESARNDLSSTILEDYFPEYNSSASYLGFNALLSPSSSEAPVKHVPLHEQPSAHMLFASQNDSIVHLFNYSVRVVGLDTNITCNATSSGIPDCRAIQQQVATNRYVFDPLLAMSQASSETHRRGLMEEWNRADYYDPSSTEKYLAGNSFPGNISANWPPKWDTVSKEVLSKRMTTLFNTYFQAFVSPISHARVTFRETPDSTQSDYIAWRLAGQTWNPYLNRTTGISAKLYPVYKVEWPWLITLVVVNVCLQALGILGLILQFCIQGPDILGYASSLTRENPYVGVPPGGSSLDGPARSKVLQRMRVQLVDIRSDETVGYIALRELRQEHQPRRLDSQRLYG